MKTVLIGSDFMYDKDGVLKPIEINTAVGWDGIEKIEEDIDCLDLTGLYEFVNNYNFQTIHYIGAIEYFHKTLQSHYSGTSVDYQYHSISKESITIPFIEDNDTTLIIRSAYDTTAIVDETYCRDKVEFMKLIQSESFGSQFAYINGDGELVNTITNITDNGIHPNFILKYRFPIYDTEVYPKFFKVSNQTELDSVINENVTAEYFLMENYVNEENAWNGHLKVIRSLNLLYPPTLESIQLGQYTKINHNLLQETVTYNENFKLDSIYRESYLTNLVTKWSPKLLDTDFVEMGDGTFKTALDLQVGDIIKTIDISKSDSIPLSGGEYVYTDLTYETLVNNTTYSTNEVTFKKRINRISVLCNMTFNDGSTWEDTLGSSYLVDIDGVIQFKTIGKLKEGDVILLLNTNNENIDFVRKTIVSNVESVRVFSGWLISVAVEQLFLTKTTSTNNESYVSIEHNLVFCPAGCLYTGQTCPACPKGEPWCVGYGVCSSTPPTIY
jgi:hypothetical protein